MKIYLYAEHCTRAGYPFIGDEEDAEQTDDAFLYAEGDRESIIAEAIESLQTRHDHRAGGAGDEFRWKCDIAALDMLDGPTVIFDPSTMAYTLEGER